MIGFGVPLGATMPNQAMASYPGRPASDTVGTAGIEECLLALVTASILSFPELTNGKATGRLGNIKSSRPATTSVNASIGPLYGTCTTLIPARTLNNSAVR